MTGSDDGLRVYDRLHTLLLGVHDIHSFLDDLARLATEVVTPSSCGITLRYAGSLLTVGSSDSRAEIFDETQYQAATGPCLQAFASGIAVECPDIETETRWPDYVAVTRAAGLRCSISLPLTVRGRTFGALNVYGFDRIGRFGEDERRQLELFAAQASGIGWLATRQMKDSALLQQMEEALGSRMVIDQAMGIIMGQQHCTAEAAFALLRAESQSTHRRLNAVAADLVRRVTGHAPREGRPFDS